MTDNRSGKQTAEQLDALRITKDIIPGPDDMFKLGEIAGCIDNLISTDLTDVISDGYHTFGDLYNHRMILTKTIAYMFKDIETVNEKLYKVQPIVYRSKKHALTDPNEMFEGYFIVVFRSPEGDFSYHYRLEHWDEFDFLHEEPRAGKYDGHTPDDIGRLFTMAQKLGDIYKK